MPDLLQALEDFCAVPETTSKLVPEAPEWCIALHVSRRYRTCLGNGLASALKALVGCGWG
eukprot:11029008-Alexandrium_andersonii.AAC.2